MTIIAAIATREGVYMACDTRADCDGTAMYKAEGKIGTLTASNGDKLLLGVAGNSAILPTLLRHLKVGDVPDPARDYDATMWANGIAETATGVLADTNPPLVSAADSDSPGAFDGMALLGWRHRLWVLHTHGVIEPHGGVAAIGSGAEIGLGSLLTTSGFDVSPQTRVELAVRLASTYSIGCGIDDRGPLLHTTVD